MARSRAGNIRVIFLEASINLVLPVIQGIPSNQRGSHHPIPDMLLPKSNVDVETPIGRLTSCHLNPSGCQSSLTSAAFHLRSGIARIEKQRVG